MKAVVPVFCCHTTYYFKRFNINPAAKIRFTSAKTRHKQKNKIKNLRPALICKYATKKHQRASLLPAYAVLPSKTARFGLQHGLFKEARRALLDGKAVRHATH